MTPSPPLSRSLPARIAAFSATVLLLMGCSPEPGPGPSPTPAFASEEEAFAAAEETYRAYNDASNARRSGDATAKPEDYLAGAALEADMSASEYLRSLGLKVTGEVEILEFQGLTADVDGDRMSLTALVCLDSSGTRVVNFEGTDMTPPQRAGIIALRATMTSTGRTFLIEDEAEAPGEEC